MSRVTLLDTDYATLWYYPDAKIVHHTFHKFIYGDQLRAMLGKGLETFQQEGVTKWLSDDRNNTAVPQADIDWSLEEWMPAMMKAGWKYWAVVLPNKAVGKQSMARVIEAYSQLGLTIDVFDDPDEALHWLEVH
ncbi:MAG: hypothetical protein K8I82_25025 [Anaerolineae bacterium]|nr:hypothetical protein [Anaerolineae bacterium]